MTGQGDRGGGGGGEELSKEGDEPSKEGEEPSKKVFQRSLRLRYWRRRGEGRGGGS